MSRSVSEKPDEAKDAARSNGFVPAFKIVSWPAVLLVLTLVTIAVVATYMTYGKFHAEKIATQLAMPMGLLWLGTLYVSLAGLFHRNRPLLGFGLIACSIIYLAGCPTVSDQIMRSLENKHPALDASTSEPFDTLFVLGGGVGLGQNRQIQFNQAGDRVGLAVRLYKAGKAKKLVTTGDSARGNDDPSAATLVLFREFGIPEADISELPGLNTYEEMQGIRAHPELWKGKRAGVISSAFHMPRVMRLAKRAGVELVPVPSNFRATYTQWTPARLFPNAESFAGTEIALREYLGMMLGR
jgi:uncharacterized SAM-binding protein YcdF (DUF218 family)